MSGSALSMPTLTNGPPSGWIRPTASIARQLTTRLGVVELKVPRTRSGHFHPQVLARYQRREPVINQALKAVFLLGVSTRQTGHALASLVEEAVSASTVSAVAKALDVSVGSFHRASACRCTTAI